MKIIILGPTGTGKGTQAKLIAKLLKLNHIEIGKEFRKIANYDKYIKELISKGKLVPDNITLKLVKNLIKNNKNFILDGFPRDLNQTKSFKEKIDLVLYLKTSKKNLIKRLLLRKRFDDTKKNIEERYEIFLKRTLPVINYYKKGGILKVIDGNPSIKNVSKEIKKVLIRFRKFDN